MILIYSDVITPRLEYTVHLVFSEILGTDFRITQNIMEYQKEDLPKLNYSATRLGEGFNIFPHTLLFEKDIRPQDVTHVVYQDEVCFFRISTGADLPFDPFAAIFYLVSRYEEYLQPARDKFYRYQAEHSILTVFGLLKKPIVNIWIKILAKEILNKYPGWEFQIPGFRFISTIDVDNAWAYLHKGFGRTMGAFVKALFYGKFSEVKNRIQVIAGRKPDPYDTYGYLDRVFSENKNKVRFFFLLADYGRFDKSVPYNNRTFSRLIRKTASQYQVGIHPSFRSGSKMDEKLLGKEIGRLKKIISNDVMLSRQHFLLLSLPDSYRMLVKQGIREDYSMGYASHTGFRAGICTPFSFYDLQNEEPTDLKVYPFQLMDVTLRDYLHYDPQKFISEADDLMQEVKKVGGTFICIWHNESVNNKGHWRGYQKVFEKINHTGFEWCNE